MTPIIVYKSHTGFTEAYVHIMAENLNCKYIPLSQLSKTDLSSYDVLIYGGSVRAAKISGLKKAIQSFQRYRDKKIVIFAVGGNGLSDENTDVLIANNLKANDYDYPFFYMQGGFDPGKLNFALKAMLGSVAKSLKKKEATDPASLSREDREFLDFFQDAHNNVSEANTESLVGYIRDL